MRCLVLLIPFFLLGISASDGEEENASSLDTRTAPNGEYFVAWSDVAAPDPVHKVRTIYAYVGPDYGFDAFSLVTHPRFTEAAWSADSSRFVVADAPDNGNLDAWLVARTDDGWKREKIFPVKELEERFYAEKRNPIALFRPSLLELRWLDRERIHFQIQCNLGIFDVVIDSSNPAAEPEISQRSE